MSILLSPPRFPLALIWQQVKRIGPLGLIILAHIGFFYVLQSRLLRHAAQATLPKSIFATFITPEQPQQPDVLKRPPAAPKTVQVVKKALTPPPAVPVVNTTPSQQAITVPHVQSQPAETLVAAVAPASPLAPATPAQPKLISSGIEYIEQPRPDYPLVSKRMREEGSVMLRVLVSDKGRPERVDVQKSSGSARLDDAARQAVLRAVFKPHVEDGQPVAVYAIVPIKFQLDS